MKKVLVIAGATASGKSDFAVECAKRFSGEVISGDSIQVYKGLDIGSGKVTEEEMDGVVHHLLDICDPKDNYSVSDFQKDARHWMDTIEGLPIIIGGTGLYLKACLYDYVFEEEEEEAFEEDCYKDLSNEELYEMLVSVDPEQAKKIHPNNRRRTIRSLTIYKRSGIPQSKQVAAQNHEMLYDAMIVACDMDRKKLYERIDLRVEKMFERGLLDEVQGLLDAGVTFEDQCMKGIGYREFEPYMKGECTVEDVKRAIQTNSRRYAKRQYTWLRHQMPCVFFDRFDEASKEKMLEEIEVWINS